MSKQSANDVIRDFCLIGRFFDLVSSLCGKVWHIPVRSNLVWSLQLILSLEKEEA